METKEYKIETEKYFKRIISNQEKIIKPLEELIKSIPIPEMIIKSDKVNIQIMEYVTNIINKKIKKDSFLNTFHVEITNHIRGWSFNEDSILLEIRNTKSIFLTCYSFIMMVIIQK